MDARDTEHMKEHNLKLHQYSISQIEKISRNKKIICFGSGNNLTRIFYAMWDLHIEERVHYIIDNDSEKWGSSRLLNGRSCDIENPERLKSENWDSHILFITMIEYHAVLKQLEHLLNGTKAVCLVSPVYRYWYDRFIDKLTLKQAIQNIIVLQGEGDTCENAKALIQEFRKQKKYTEYKVVWLSDKSNENDGKDRSEKYLQREFPLKRHRLKEIYDYYKYINRAHFLIYENRMIPKVRDEQISCYMNHGIPLKATKGKITVYKDTDYPITMTCTGSSGLSGLSYDAMAYSTKGGSSEEYTLDAGRMAVFREVSGFKGGGVYIQGALNGWDADSFWGTWNPDNPHY